MENGMERLGPPPPSTPEAPPAVTPGGIPERADPLTNLAIAASIRFGQEVLGLTDTNGPIDGTMTRSEVYGQAEAQPVIDTHAELTPEFMTLRRGVMLEYLGVDRQAQSRYADVLDAFEFVEDGYLKDPLEHMLIGDFASTDAITSESTTEKVVKMGGVHHMPSALKVMQGDALTVIEDRTKKDVKGRSKERGLQKLTFDLEGYTKDVSTTFPEDSSTEQVLGWLQDAMNDPDAITEQTIDNKTGELRGYVKWHFDSSPGGMDIKMSYDTDMRLITAMPVDKPENQMKRLGLQESKK